MKYLVIVFLLITTPAMAGQWVCFDATTKHINKTYQGDGFARGLCDQDNSNIISTCILATSGEYTSAKQSHKKVDVALSSGSRVIDWTASEITAEAVAAQAEADAATTTAVNNLDVTLKEAFIAFLTVYNSKVPVGVQITPAELKAQALTDKGL